MIVSKNYTRITYRIIFPLIRPTISMASVSISPPQMFNMNQFKTNSFLSPVTDFFNICIYFACFFL